MVFLKEQVEQKNGNEYTNYYFYHGNKYLGKADEGLSTIQSNIRDELGSEYDQDKIEHLLDQAQQKMREAKEDDYEAPDLPTLDIENWEEGRRTVEDVAWINQKTGEHVSVERQQEFETEEVDNPVGYVWVVEVSHEDLSKADREFGDDWEAASEFAEEYMRGHKTEEGDLEEEFPESNLNGIEYELNDSGFEEFSRVEDTDYIFEWVHDSQDLKVVVERDGDHSWSSRVYENGSVEENIVEGMLDPQKAMFRAEAWIKEYENGSSVKNNELSDVEASVPEIGEEFYHVRVRDPNLFTEIRVPEWSKNVARSEVAGSKVKMGKQGEDWKVQSVLFKKDMIDRSETQDKAELIAKKVDGSENELNDSGIKWDKQSDDRFFYKLKVSHPDKAFDSRFRIEVIGEAVEFIDHQAFGSDKKIRKSFDSNEEAIEWAKDKKLEVSRNLEEDGWNKVDTKNNLSDSDTWIYKGDDFADKLANEELIYQDWDEDDIANIDDRNPLEPGSAESERVNDEILLSEELKNIEELSEKHREVADIIDAEMDVHKARVKQPESILKKLHEKYSEEVTDIIGVTVLAEDKAEVMEIAEDLKSEHDLFDIGEERADENHYEDDGFYRAYHLIIAVEHEGDTYPAEVQIKTEEQAKLHALAHEYYKKGHNEMPELLQEKARQLESGEIDSVDKAELKKKLP